MSKYSNVSTFTSDDMHTWNESDVAHALRDYSSYIEDISAQGYRNGVIEYDSCSLLFSLRALVQKTFRDEIHKHG